MRWLRQWAPAIAWALLISGFSTRYFTVDETSRFLLPAFHWLLPHASFETLAEAQFFIRKLAHFSEYFVFSLLLLHGFRSGRREWKWRWAVAALALAACYSALDELHQALPAPPMPRRRPAPGAGARPHRLASRFVSRHLGSGHSPDRGLVVCQVADAAP